MTTQPPAQTHLAAALVYTVQCSVNKNAKSRYETRFSGVDRAQAELMYAGLNVGYGYRKRLTVYSPEFFTTRVLRKEVS